MTATSGTYAFQLNGGDIVIECFDRIQIRPSALTTDHLKSISMSMNLVQSRFANRGVNLWTVAEITIPLVEGVATYSIDDQIVFLAPDSFLRQTQNTAITDTILFPLSRSDYAGVSVKTTQGRPTSYYFDRLVSPTVTLWPVPDANGPYEFHYYRATQQQDMATKFALAPDLPFRFYEAFCAAVTSHLSMKWQPQMRADLEAYAKECWVEASDEDREKVTMYIGPDWSGYFTG